MAQNGVTTPFLASASLVDELVGNRGGSTVRVGLQNVAAQLAATGAVAERLDQVEGLVTTGARLAATWDELRAAAGDFDGQGGEVLDADAGAHAAASATGYDGAPVDNAGRYAWNAAWSRWVRVGGSGLAAKADASALAALAASTDLVAADIAYFQGSQRDRAGAIEEGFVRKADGEEGASPAWRRTGFIPVTSKHWIRTTAAPMGDGYNAANIVFFDAARRYVAHMNLSSPSQTVQVADYEDGTPIRHVRVTQLGTEGFSVYAEAYIDPSSVKGLAELLASSAAVDHFDVEGVQLVIVKTSGEVLSGANWRTTPLIPVSVGQSFVYEGTGYPGVAMISAWNAAGAFIGSRLSTTRDGGGSEDGFVFTVVDPATAFVRATAATTGPYSFVTRQAASTGYAPQAFDPGAVYAIEGQTTYLYAKSLCPDPAISLTWSMSGASPRAAAVTPASQADIDVALFGRGPDNVLRTLAAFPIKVAAATAVEPPRTRVLNWLGDSTIFGKNSGLKEGFDPEDPDPDIDGAVPQEVMRQLTGVGARLVPSRPRPDAALTRVVSIGTQGDAPGFHDGHSGKTAGWFMNDADSPLRFGGRADYGRYITSNGWDGVSDPVNGVTASGDNLTVIIELAWNNVYNTSLAAAVDTLRALIAHIRSVYPEADIVLLGLWPAPEQMVKTFSGPPRKVSEREVWEQAVRTYGVAYRDLAASMDRVVFLPIAPVFDAETGFPRADYPVSAASSATYSAAWDHVHPWAHGYRYIADALVAYLRFTYFS